MEDVEELLPVVYAPTVGEACQKYGSIFMCPQGLYITLKEKGRILEVLRNWPEKNIQFIVVTDGERILGLGDLGCQGMGIPVGKLSLYTALGGVHPSACLPITIDVGTNNENSLNDELYIGLKQRRATGQEYDELMHEFMSAVKQNYGEKVLIQFKDFANHNAFDLLEKYRSTHLVFNDDIQGTASVVLAGLVAALKLVGGNLADHRILFLGAGEAGTGIAELIALETSKQTNAPLDEVPKNIWLVDSKGLIVGSRKELLQHFKKPWAHDHEPVHRLVDDVNKIKPTVLIGTSGQGRTSTTEVIEAMASTNEKPIILSLSNPSSQSECTAEEAYKWSQGRAIFASGSPFPPVEYEGKVFVPGQANNAYIFPEQSRDSPLPVHHEREDPDQHSTSPPPTDPTGQHSRQHPRGHDQQSTSPPPLSSVSGFWPPTINTAVPLVVFSSLGRLYEYANNRNPLEETAPIRVFGPWSTNFVEELAFEYFK
nr:NADP-dependent malic enzyme 4, chloroplastic-like [Arachis hypogaea]